MRFSLERVIINAELQLFYTTYGSPYVHVRLHSLVQLGPLLINLFVFLSINNCHERIIHQERYNKNEHRTG